MLQYLNLDRNSARSSGEAGNDGIVNLSLTALGLLFYFFDSLSLLLGVARNFLEVELTTFPQLLGLPQSKFKGIVVVLDVILVVG